MEGSVIANRYIINGVIGSGGMAIVYRGYDRETGDEVAIKVLRSEYMEDDNYVRRFEKESQIAIKYSHKNIVKTMEVGCQDGRHYIVMEYVLGMTLKEYISHQGRLRPPEAVRIGRQICDALFYAHSHQLVHRDIKPQNILISHEGIIKVADFGIAKAPDSATMTISGSNVLGSVHYISPEQARGVSTDEKADIYSMGIVLYEMVTGTVPFTGDTPVAIALKHLQDAPRPPRELAPDIPKALELVILKAVAKDPSVRYDNAREMARDLERTLLEPEGNYIHIKRAAEDFDGTRPLHILRGEGGVTSTGAGSSTGAGASVSRVPLRPKRRGPSAVNIVLYVLLTAALLATIYYAASAIIRSMLPKEVTVQNYVGMDQERAEAQLKAMEIPHTFEPATSDDVEKGIIMDQDPAKGNTLPGDGVLVLTVSQGREPVAVPDLSDMTQQAARDTLTKLGLKLGNVLREESPKAKDTVIRQNPMPQETLPKGSNVDIWLAKPAAVENPTMPKLLFMDKQKAFDRLYDLGLVVANISTEPMDSSQPEGTVLRQSPEEGVPLDGQMVTLWVSSGTAPDYRKEFELHFQVTKDSTRVRVLFVDGQDVLTVYDESMDTGEYDRTVTLESATLGQKTVKLVIDGVEKKWETVTFVEEDAN